MKLLRRFSGGTLALISSIVLLGTVFTGCKTAPEKTAFTDAPPAPVATTPAAGTTTGKADTRKPIFLDVPPTPVTLPPVTSGAPPDNKSESFIKSESYFKVGDIVTITFSGIPDAPQPQDLEILGDGTITLSLIGSVKAAGKTLGELQNEIQKSYNKFYNPSSGFTVTVKSQARVFYIGGEIRSPGPKLYLAETTVTKAIQTAGDFTDFANKRKVRLTRSDGTTITVNCVKAMKSPRLDPLVFPGDRLHVPRRLW